MKDFKGTQGTWVINPAETLHCDIGVMSPLIKEGKAAPGFSFKTVARCYFAGDLGVESEANGKLILAALDMAEALQEFVAYAERGNELDRASKAYKQAKAALAKALD